MLAVCSALLDKIGIVQKAEMLMLLQVAVLTCHADIALPPFMALRHLIVHLHRIGTGISANLPITTLGNATSLETLSLGIFGKYADWSQTDRDMSSLHALEHVCIVNFAPRKLHVRDGCLLHVKWDEGSTNPHKFRRWAQVRSLWQAEPNCLGSLQISCQASEPDTAVLKTILTGDQEPLYISLSIPRLGDEMEPFLVDPGCCQMLALAKRVRFCSKRVCSISVTNMQPKWKYLSIDAARVTLQVEDTAALMRSIDSFWIEGFTTHGFSSLSMMNELHQSGRKCSVNEQSLEAAEGTPPGFSFGTLLDCAAQSSFEELMDCGCLSCLACLSRGGKLSRDSERPQECWHVSRYTI